MDRRRPTIEEEDLTCTGSSDRHSIPAIPLELQIAYCHKMDRELILNIPSSYYRKHLAVVLENGAVTLGLLKRQRLPVVFEREAHGTFSFTYLLVAVNQQYSVIARVSVVVFVLSEDKKLTIKIPRGSNNFVFIPPMVRYEEIPHITQLQIDSCSVPKLTLVLTNKNNLLRVKIVRLEGNGSSFEESFTTTYSYYYHDHIYTATLRVVVE